MERVYNFSAGPSCLPIEVLTTIQKDLLNYNNLGYSVLEMSHRSQPYYDINDSAKESLKNLMGLGDDYEILFLTGGASSQFHMIPLNLANKDDLAYYTLSGLFSYKAYDEGKRFVNAEILTSTKEEKYNHIGKIDKNKIDKNAKYVHITLNNTTVGTCYDDVPDVNGVTLVGDMSSIILGKWYDFSKFGLIYAGVQKNIGVAGVTVVIIKKSLIRDDKDNLPLMENYKTHFNNNSIYNTPPVFPIYVVMLMAQWIQKQGGIKAIEDINIKKSKILYDYIDSTNFYVGTVSDKKDRSPMNVTFLINNESLLDKFLQEAKENGLINLKGHKSAGGIRASIYNSMPIEGVKKLCEFMEKFEKENK